MKKIIGKATAFCMAVLLVITPQTYALGLNASEVERNAESEYVAELAGGTESVSATIASEESETETYQLLDGAVVFELDWSSSTATFTVNSDATFVVSTFNHGRMLFYSELVDAGMQASDTFVSNSNYSFPGIEKIVIEGDGCLTVGSEFSTSIWPDVNTFDASQGNIAKSTASLGHAQFIYLLNGCDVAKFPDGYALDIGSFGYLYTGSTITDLRNWSFDTITGSDVLATEVYFPATLKYVIDDDGETNGMIFRTSTVLESVTFAEGTELEYLGSEAFASCTALTSIELPKTVTYLGAGMFRNCTSLKTAVLPETIGEIGTDGYGIFMGCSTLEEVVLPYDVTYPLNTFSKCSSLKKVTVTGVPTSDAVNESLMAALEWEDDIGNSSDVDLESLEIILEIENWYVHFETGEGSSVDTILVSSGETIGDLKPADPTREGYVFTGWYADEACTQLWNFEDAVEADMTLYAGWEAAPVELTSDMFTIDTSDVKWAGESATKDITVKDGDKTLVEGTDYTVSYEGNDGPGTATVTVTGIGDYTGELTESFFIYYSDLPSSMAKDLDTYWYYDSVYELTARGVIAGYDANLGYRFGVGDSILRRDVVVMLWRYTCPEDAAAYDASATKSESGLSDVADGQYYTGAINWAVEAGVISGYEDGSFGVDDPITFEQLVTVLVRMAAGEGTAESYSTSSLFSGGYADASQVSAFAQSAMSWAVENGLAGRDTVNLLPLSNVERERVATVLLRYIDMAEADA